MKGTNVCDCGNNCGEAEPIKEYKYNMLRLTLPGFLYEFTSISNFLLTMDVLSYFLPFAVNKSEEKMGMPERCTGGGPSALWTQPGR
jgi:hypothetical protein